MIGSEKEAGFKVSEFQGFKEKAESRGVNVATLKP
jgi:hypothetical protein